MLLAEYVHALEEERRKIEAFRRELPISLQLVTQEIESYRKEMASKAAVTEEFIPLKPTSSSSEVAEGEKKHGGDAAAHEGGKPADWLRSVRLWNQDSDPVPGGDRPLCKPVAVHVRKCGGAFHPFERDRHAASPAPPVAAASSAAEVEEEREEVGQSQSQPRARRKARRCWSPELHRRFLHALQQLGGSHAATPKHIRELMKVDELTNDEVKSHLQKYRLHIRRPTQALQAESSSQTPQFVLVGSLWMPPPDYAAAAATVQSASGTDTSRTEIYAPVASLPSELRFRHQENNKKQHSQGSPKGPLLSAKESRGDNSLTDDGATKSASIATSSSS